MSFDPRKLGLFGRKGTEPLPNVAAGASGQAPETAPTRIKPEAHFDDTTVSSLFDFASIVPGLRIAGRHPWVLEQRLGRGGYGTVFLARRDTTVGEGSDRIPERVAIKFFPTHDPEAARRFLSRETSAYRQLNTDRVPRLHDWNIDNRLAFFAMDYYAPGSLGDAFDLGLRFDEPMLVRLLGDVLTALVAAHRASLLHLDIKPANVLLDGLGGYVLTDFGISMATWSNEIEGARTPGLGTMGYQAPEQRALELDKIDARTDLWGLGATAWSLATGINLSCTLEVFGEARGTPFGLATLKRRRPDLPEWLSDLVMSLLYSDPQRRPGSAAEALTVLESQARGLPMPSDVYVATRAARSSPDEIDAVIRDLMDPLWAAVFKGTGTRQYIVKFEAGETMCREGEREHYVMILLSGRVAITRMGAKLGVDEREGSFLGEISALTGTIRTASVVAETPVWACVLNGADFERFVAFNPAVGLRLIKLLAERVVAEHRRATTGQA